MGIRLLFWTTALSLLVLSPVGRAVACTELRPSPGIPERDGVLYETPVYDPVTKRYFALNWARSTKDAYRATSWANASAAAKSRQYKGVHGRLAIVDTPEVHSFLLQTFHPPCEAWIGLRYWCGARALEWSSGQAWQPGAFNAWDKVWRQDENACRGADAAKDYMPVAYSRTPNGFRWIGKGLQKEYFAYFIEYPTGQP